MNNAKYYDYRTTSNVELQHIHVPHNRLFWSDEELSDYCASYGYKEPRYDSPLNFNED